MGDNDIDHQYLVEEVEGKDEGDDESGHEEEEGGVLRVEEEEDEGDAEDDEEEQDDLVAEVDALEDLDFLVVGVVLW